MAPLPAIEQVTRDVVTRRSVLSDRRGSYLSVRPAPTGAIAAYFHPATISIAVDPDHATAVAARFPGSSLDHATQRARLPHLGHRSRRKPAGDPPGAGCRARRRQTRARRPVHRQARRRSSRWRPAGDRSPARPACPSVSGTRSW